MRVRTLIDCQLLPEALADTLQNLIGHPHDVELIDDDASLWQHRLDSATIGLTYIHADDHHLVAVGHTHEAPCHRLLLATRQQIQQGAFLQVGQDATVAAVQIQLVDPQITGCLEAVLGRQELGLLLEDISDGLLV